MPTMTDRVKVQAILQARTGSTRLRNKIFESISGKPLLKWVVERLQASKSVERVVIATSTHPDDVRVVEFAKSAGAYCMQASEEDVLGRFVDALDIYPADNVVRATGDNPLLDPGLVDLLIESHLKNCADYTGADGILPLGVSAEVVSSRALRIAAKDSTGTAFREHVTSYIYSHAEKFSLNSIPPPDYLSGRNYRLTVDTKDDLALMRKIGESLEKEGKEFNATNAVALLDARCDLVKLNSHIRQKNWKDQLPGA